MTGRGSTHPGRPAALPTGLYATTGNTPVNTTPLGEVTELVVAFTGEDGRNTLFDVGALPLPGWHESLAAAWAARIGPAGGLRTMSSADGSWGAVRRLMRFLDQRIRPPAEPSRLTAADVEAFFEHRARPGKEGYAWMEVRLIGMLLATEPLQSMVAQEVFDFIGRRTKLRLPPPKPGYSDRELRQILTAARADTGRIRDRITSGERLLERWRTQPGTLTGVEQQLAEALSIIAVDGDVPLMPGLDFVRQRRERTGLAAHLFVTRQDLLPLMALLTAVTGRNIETLKELPAEHRILEGRAIELRLTKRRRGTRNWHETVTWEIGEPARELQTPGGLYLLLHWLMARSRAVSGTTCLWSVWRQPNPDAGPGTSEHYNPFALQLGADIGNRGWAASHGLVADGDQPAWPLRVDMQRLRTSIEVRRTKQLGGHLPSAARTNTMPVLFRDYRRNDPTAIDWARDTVAVALVDAERSALAAHHRMAETAGGAPRILRDPDEPASGSDTGWTICTDPEDHPVTGKRCQASFLDCFHCRNCVITGEHLPRLLALLDALAARRQQLGVDPWWNRYGPAWAAIRHDILAKFTPAEIEQAAAAKPDNPLLDLIEQPWELP
jgi:hypothetical protein